MAQAALAVPAVSPTAIRRFQLPDLDQHRWILGRLLQAYRHLTEREAVGWLRGIVYSNEFLFLYHTHGVALAQTYRPTLAPKAILQERFVWVENRQDKAQLEAAADFYLEFERHAIRQGIGTIVVEEMSDVPHDLIKERLKSIFTREQVFARVGKE